MEQILTPSEPDKSLPPSCVLSLSFSFTLAQFPSNLPLPPSLTFSFIPFLLLPFFSFPLCPCLSVSLSSLLPEKPWVCTIGSGLSSSSKLTYVPDEIRPWPSLSQFKIYMLLP